MSVNTKTERMIYVKILEPATLPTEPLPTQKMSILTSPLLGIMVGVTLALFLEYLDNSIKTVEDVTANLGLTVIGIIPHVDVTRKITEKYDSVMSKEGG